MAEKVLEVKNIQKSYDRQPVLKDISFSEWCFRATICFRIWIF